MGISPAALSMEPSVEWDLVRRAREGDPAAFEDLYRENVGRVFALCLRMCGERGRAEDLTQEAFVRAWSQLGTFRGESRFSSWLHRLAANVVLGDDRRRSRRLDPARGSGDPSSIEAAFSGSREGRSLGRDDPTGGAPGAPASRATGRADLERAIAALPPGAREVLVLHDIEGYRHEEIAGMTGRSAGTSRAQLHRARRLLREALR